jgi:putative redox protein
LDVYSGDNWQLIERSATVSIKQAVIRQVHGITFAAKSDSNHWTMIDGPALFDGSEAGPRPKELLLFALGGCTASDVIPILKKKRVKLDGFELHLTAIARDEHPQIFTDIHIEYVFFGDNIDRASVERAIELSTTKYCSVSAMLKGNVKITHSSRIEAAQAAEPHQMSATP